MDLEVGTLDEEYLRITENAARTALVDSVPEIVSFQAAVDPLAGDRFSRLALSRNGLIEQNKIVMLLWKECTIRQRCKCSGPCRCL